MDTWVRIENIEAKMKEIIEAATLNVVLKSVIVGRKERSSKFNPPLIWIFANESAIDSTSAGINEEWQLKYIIAGVIKSYEHIDGKGQAEELVLRATAELLKNRINRTLDGNCRDIIRTRWVPGFDRVIDDDTLFGAGIEIEVRFQTREVC